MKVRCTSLSSDDGPHYELLSQHGFSVLPGNRNRDYRIAADLIEELSGCVAIVAGAEPYPREVLTALPDLRVIARTGVGFDAIDLDCCNELGIVVTITPGVNHHAVAEHTIALLMGVARGFPDRDQYVRQGNWVRFNTPRIMGCRLGLIGLGRIGKAVAERAVGLGMDVLAYDPFFDRDFAEKQGIQQAEIDEILSISDYVSLHLPAGPETKHFINKETLAKMKQGSILINTARGSLVDETALCDALESGHLRGAGLDVFEVEPLPLNSPLLKQKRVLLCGHLAGFDEQSQWDTLTMAAETIVALKEGNWPQDVMVNMQGVTDWTWEKS